MPTMVRITSLQGSNNGLLRLRIPTRWRATSPPVVSVSGKHRSSCAFLSSSMPDSAAQCSATPVTSLVRSSICVALPAPLLWRRVALRHADRPHPFGRGLSDPGPAGARSQLHRTGQLELLCDLARHRRSLLMADSAAPVRRSFWRRTLVAGGVSLTFVGRSLAAPFFMSGSCRLDGSSRSLSPMFSRPH